jgi:hypothetical protein
MQIKVKSLSVSVDAEKLHKEDKQDLKQIKTLSQLEVRKQQLADKYGVNIGRVVASYCYKIKT